jgi:ribosome-binding factor A
MPNKSASSNSPRQLKVGEELRHQIAAFFLESPIYDGILKDKSITITEVKISPDLKNATIFATILGLEIPTGAEHALNEYVPTLKHFLSRRRVRLRFMPQFRFRIDQRLLKSAHLDEIFSKLTPTSSTESSTDFSTDEKN